MHMAAVDAANLPAIGLLSHLSGSLAIAGAVWSKTSFGITLLRIVTDRRTKAAVWFVIISMNLAMSVSVLVNWIQCNPIPKGWDGRVPGTCWEPRITAYYGVFAAGRCSAILSHIHSIRTADLTRLPVYSGVMDIVLALLPWTLVWGLQMKRKEKIGISLAMSMGVL